MVKKSRQWTVGVLAGLVVVGAALRVWGIQAISLDVDEAITISAARGFMATGVPRILASGLYYGRDMLGTLTTAASLSVFGVTEWAARLPMVMLGVATIPLTYALSRKLAISRIWSCLAAGGMTFSAWGIYTAHSARMYQEQQFFVLLAALAAVWTLQRWRWYSVTSLGLCCVLAVFAHRSAIVITFPILGVLIWNNRQKIKHWMQSPAHRYAVWISSACVIALFLGSELKWGMVSGSTHYILGTDKNPWSGMQLHLIPFRHLLRTYPVWSVSFLLAWAWVKKQPAVQVLLWITWGTLLAVDILIYPHEPNYRTRYFYDVMPFVFILGALGLDHFWEWVKQHIKLQWVQASFLLICLVTLGLRGMTIFPWSVYASQPEWNRVQGIQAPVVIAHPTAPAAYYLGHVDYWLVSHKGEIRTYSENNRDIYAGASILLDPHELATILDTQDGVVVLEVNRFEFISKDLLNTLHQHAKKDQDLSTALLQVWRF